MSRPLKVLLIEDNPADAEMELLELRSAGFEPDWRRVETEAEFLEQLNSGLDLVLSDFQMPEFNGLRALELLTQRELDVPFILVSGTIGEDTAVAAIRSGATDYLLKDRLARLGPAVTHALAETGLRRERRQLAEAAQRQQVELKASQKRLRDIIDGVGPSIFVGLMTLQGILIECNRPALTAAGLKPEDVMGKPFDETPWWSHSPETQRQLRESIARAARGEASRYDVRIRGAGDQVIDIAWAGIC